MSLSTVSTASVIKKQFLFKLKGNIDAFSSLLFVQIAAILFSLGGTSEFSSTSDMLILTVKFVSADIVIILTMIWAFVSGITVTTKQMREQDFTFVTNRLTSSLSNILFLILIFFIAAVFAMLTSYFIHIVAYFSGAELYYSSTTGFVELVVGIGASFLYFLLLGALGYLVGTMVQLSRFFVVLLPVLALGSIIAEGLLLGKEPFLMSIVEFFVFEKSFALFALKVLVAAGILFLAATGIWNRLEVRK